MSEKIIIHPIPAFKDNYIWLVYNTDNLEAVIVDPGMAEPVIETLEKFNLKLTSIFVTHHHADHSGGINDLILYKKNMAMAIYGSPSSPLSSITHPVKENIPITAASLTWSIADIPGHTLDHIAFYSDNYLFCGDTLFSMGCGKIFEGTPALMFQSLQKLYQLNENTQVYCGHEYTLANLQFAKKVLPGNAKIDELIRMIQLKISKTNCSLPSTLAIEKAYNLFLRCHEPDIIAAVQNHSGKKLVDPLEVFAYLREWKNSV